MQTESDLSKSLRRRLTALAKPDAGAAWRQLLLTAVPFMIGFALMLWRALRLRAGPHDLALVTFPGEPTHDVGLVAREAAQSRGATQTFPIGLALDHVGYLASRREYRRGGYEAHTTLFGERAAEGILAAHEELLTALGYPSPAKER